MTAEVCILNGGFWVPVLGSCCASCVLSCCACRVVKFPMFVAEYLHILRSSNAAVKLYE